MGVKLEVINIDGKRKGLLKITGNTRSIPVMVETLPGARECDTDMLMQEICNAYSRYIQRVHEYSAFE